ncbi:hypothetical protein FB451DRAFT_1186805 [Mycena latifolia]|nr:hypothetical protein FB451DRAFT_1186805 [Mycena latifolia]
MSHAKRFLLMTSMASATPTSTRATPSKRTLHTVPTFFKGLFKSLSKNASISSPRSSKPRQDTEVAARERAHGKMLYFHGPPNTDGNPGTRPRASLNSLWADDSAAQGTNKSTLNSSAVTGALSLEGPAADAVSAQAQAQGSDSAITMKDSALSAWHGFKVVVKTAEAFLGGTPFKTPIAVLNTLIGTTDAVVENKESVAALLLPLGQRLSAVIEELSQNAAGLPNDINPTCEHFASALQVATENLKSIYEQGLLKRISELDETPREIQKIFRHVDEATKNFQA